MAKQHLDTHVKDLHSMADSFNAFWLASRTADGALAADWPMLMSEGEWWEQFIAWAQEHDGKPAVDA